MDAELLCAPSEHRLRALAAESERRAERVQASHSPPSAEAHSRFRPMTPRLPPPFQPHEGRPREASTAGGAAAAAPAVHEVREAWQPDHSGPTGPAMKASEPPATLDGAARSEPGKASEESSTGNAERLVVTDLESEASES